MDSLTAASVNDYDVRSRYKRAHTISALGSLPEWQIFFSGGSFLPFGLW